MNENMALPKSLAGFQTTNLKGIAMFFLNGMRQEVAKAVIGMS
jgi:hypothetical protein